MKAENAEIRAEVKAQGARIEALGSRIDMLQKVIWPLIGLLATTVFGLLYKALTGSPSSPVVLFFGSLSTDPPQLSLNSGSPSFPLSLTAYTLE